MAPNPGSPAPPWIQQPGTIPYPGHVSPASATKTSGSPWLVVLTVAVALTVLAVVAAGIAVAVGGSKAEPVKEIPSRLDPLPSTTTVPAGPSTTAPSPGGTGTTVPGAPANGIPKLDTTTPKVKVTDTEGRFEITVPRSWVGLPGITPDSAQWRLFEQGADGSLGQTDFLFVVTWFPSNGCGLEACAAEHVDRLKLGRPSLTVTSNAASVGSRPAVRLDSSVTDQRLAGWVVVQDDRYWAMELVGPPDGFDALLPVVQSVLATMSFG